MLLQGNILLAFRFPRSVSRQYYMRPILAEEKGQLQRAQKQETFLHVCQHYKLYVARATTFLIFPVCSLCFFYILLLPCYGAYIASFQQK